MNSSRPYLIRAIYAWLDESQLTPYMMVDALYPGVKVPEQFIQEGKIVLNISKEAVGSLKLGKCAVEFVASFQGVVQHLYVPVRAVKAIYASENGRGMVFPDDEDDDHTEEDDSGGGSSSTAPSSGGRSHLRVVK